MGCSRLCDVPTKRVERRLAPPDTGIPRRGGASSRCHALAAYRAMRRAPPIRRAVTAMVDHAMDCIDAEFTDTRTEAGRAIRAQHRRRRGLHGATGASSSGRHARLPKTVRYAAARALPYAQLSTSNASSGRPGRVRPISSATLTPLIANDWVDRVEELAPMRGGCVGVDCGALADNRATKAFTSAIRSPHAL